MIGVEIKLQFMKQMILLLLIFPFLLVSTLGQTNEAQKIVEVGLENCDSTTSYLDIFLNALAVKPNDKGYVIYYDGYQLSKNKKYVIWREASYRLGFFKKFVQARKADESRIVYVNGGYRKEYAAEFWLVPPRANVPIASETVNRKNKSFRNIKVVKKILNCGEEGY